MPVILANEEQVEADRDSHPSYGQLTSERRIACRKREQRWRQWVVYFVSVATFLYTVWDMDR